MMRTRAAALAAATLLSLGAGAGTLASAQSVHDGADDTAAEQATAPAGAAEPEGGEPAPAPAPDASASPLLPDPASGPTDGAAAPGSAPQEPSPSPSPAPAPAPAAEAAGAQERLSPRGHVVKEIGDPGVLSAAGSTAPLFELTVLGVEVSRTCPGRGVAPVPEHGHFVTVDLRAHLAAQMAQELPPGTDAFLPLVPEAFEIVGPDGTVQDTVVSGSAWACFDDGALAPPFVEPGESVSGKVVLDSRTASGTVVYDPDGTGGWEWPFG